MTYAAVGAVCAPPLLGGLVDLDVLDDEVGGVETLGVGVGLSVLQKAEQELGGLDGPAGLGDTESLACALLLALPAATHTIPRISIIFPSPGSFKIYSQGHIPSRARESTHPERSGRWSQRTASWGRPPCARGHFRGR